VTRNGYLIRLAVSVAIDLLDFTIGRVPIFGSVGEGAASLVLTALWGPVGLLYLGELADFTEQADGFVPLATLIALYVGWRQGHLFARRAPTAEQPHLPPQGGRS
jgi:hypothetical protein